MTNKEAVCYGQRFGHSFPFTGADCLICGVSQSEISGMVKKAAPEKLVRERNSRIHSALHNLIDELRQEFGETAKSGKGSFAFYLGILKKIPVATIYQIRSEIKQSNCRDPKRLFWWKIGKLIKK